MDILILKTNINSGKEFLKVRNRLSKFFELLECTIDLEDRDRVLRVVGNDINLVEVTSQVNSLGFASEELRD